MLYYSPKKIAFYDDEIHLPDQIPNDALEIDENLHAYMLNHLNNGGSIQFSSSKHWQFIPAAPDIWHIWNVNSEKWETNATLQAAKLENWRENIAEITPKQLRLVLLANQVTSSDVEAAILNIEDAITREIATIEWQYGTGYSRTNANLQMIATQLLGFSEEQIDEMWKHALTL